MFRRGKVCFAEADVGHRNNLLNLHQTYQGKTEESEYIA